MSTPATRGGDETLPSSYTPSCETEKRVYVNGVRLPVGDIDLYIRSEGPLDINRYAEVTFASPFGGEDYTDIFDNFTPSVQSVFDSVEIYLKDKITNEWHLSFRGVVTGVGNSPSDNEKMWQFRSQEPSFFLDKVPASKNLRASSVTKSLQYITTELSAKLPFDVSLTESSNVNELDVKSGEEINFTIIVAGVSTNITGRIPSSKTFQANKHTLKDVVDWVRGKTGASIWLTPSVDGVNIVATEQPTKRTHTAQHLDGDGPAITNPQLREGLTNHQVAIENNDALAELKPVNTLAINGLAKESRNPMQSPYGESNPSKTYTRVKARHQSLYERSGNTELFAGTDKLSDASSSAEIKNEAKTLLKESINETTGGSMKCLLTSQIKPFDTIRAKPACDGNFASNLEPLTYEINRVHHKVRTSGMSHTELNVGIHTSMDDITIINSWEKET